MILAAKVAGSLHETLASLVEYTAITMVDRRCFEQGIRTRVFLLGFNQSLLPLLLVCLHYRLLLIGEDATLLPLELFHTFVSGPGTLKVRLTSIAKLLSLCFQLSTSGLL